MTTVRSFDHGKIFYAVDGDTLDIELDLGFYVKFKQRFRMLRIDAPERGQPGYAEATLHLKSYEGRACVIQSTKTDKYGRYLVELTVDGLNINQDMLDLGLAVPYVLR